MREEVLGKSVYLSGLTEWLRLWIFLGQGVYNGRTRFNLRRLFCYFDRHVWGSHRYHEWKGGVETDYYTVQCTRCGMGSKMMFDDKTKI